MQENHYFPVKIHLIHFTNQISIINFTFPNALLHLFVVRLIIKKNFKMNFVVCKIQHVILINYINLWQILKNEYKYLFKDIIGYFHFVLDTENLNFAIILANGNNFEFNTLMN